MEFSLAYSVIELRRQPDGLSRFRDINKVNILEFQSSIGYNFLFTKSFRLVSNEPPRDKTNKLTCAPSEGSDQPGYRPSLIRVFAVRSVGS